MHRDRPWTVRSRYADWLAGLGCALAMTGCHAWHPPSYTPPEVAMASLPQNNPAYVGVMDRDFVWEQVVDVVDDYFSIKEEERVRLVGDQLTEGRLNTFPRGGSTLLEPWNGDSATPYERLESTLQSIRRDAIVRVLPAEGGFTVDVQVYKYLEDLPRPETGAISMANAGTLRNDNSLHRVVNPVGGQQETLGWIPMGRDPALEQVMICKIQARLAGLNTPIPF